MSALSFLSLEQAQTGERFHPVLRSSMHRRLVDAGAELEERDGWLVATRIPGEERRRIAIRDVTHAYRVEEGHAGSELELGDGEHGLAPPTGTGSTFRATYRRGGGAGDEDLLDLSAAWAALEIEGPGATTVLRRLTELDLDDLPVVGAVAHVRAYVFRPEDDLYRLFFPQEYGHYLWEVVIDAAEPLGGGPAGSR